MMIDKLRPYPYIFDASNDGREYDSKEIYFNCPKCRKPIGFYKSKTACDNCGTFFDWGDTQPKIQSINKIIWDGEIL